MSESNEARKSASEAVARHFSSTWQSAEGPPDAYLSTGTEEIDEKRTLLGNRVRFRVTGPDSKWTAKVIGFVFTGDPAPGALATSMHLLHDEIAAKEKRRVPKTF